VLATLIVTPTQPAASMQGPPESVRPEHNCEMQMNNCEGFQAAADGIEQALIRFAAGQDLQDAELLATAFSEDAVLDFTQPAGELGVRAKIMGGRKDIVDTITKVTAPLITSHTITNVRVNRLDGDTAHAQALIEAMHVDRKKPVRRLLLKNLLTISAERIGPRWQIRSLTFRNLWREGEPSVLFPDARDINALPLIKPNALSVIIYQPGPNWKKGSPLAEQGLQSHGSYLAQLTRDGEILSAGPLSGTEGGLVIVAGPESAAQAIMEADPAYKEGKFFGTVTPWVPMMGWMSQRKPAEGN
jgi:uncharacterized protein YciI